MIVTGQLLAFTANAITRDVWRASDRNQTTVRPLRARRYSYDALSSLQASKGGSMSPDQYQAFLDQLVCRPETVRRGVT